MDDQVDCMYAVQNPKSVGPGASLGNHFESAEVLFNELLQRLNGGEELHFDKCMRANCEFRSWTMLGIGQDLIVRLGELDFLFQLDMQLVKVNSEVVSSRGSEVSLGMDRDVQWYPLFVKKGKILVVAFGALL